MKKHLFFLHLLISCTLLCLLHSDHIFSYAVFSLTNISVKASAASYHNTDIKHAKKIRTDQWYTTRAASHSFHYYYIDSLKKEGNITFEIQSSQRLSLSFQLYDQKGNLYPASHYTMDSVHHKLVIIYYIPAGKSYLLGLYNDKEEAFPYRIYYQNNIRDKTGNSHKNEHIQSKDKNKTAIKKTPKKPVIKSTISPHKTVNNPTTTSSDSPHKTTNNTTTARSDSPRKTTKSKNNKSKRSIFSVPLRMELSSTFLHKKCGQTVTVKSTLYGTDKMAMSWDLSTKTHVKNKSIHNTKNSSTLKLCFTQKGLYVITCRPRHNTGVSASCTVKVS